MSADTPKPSPELDAETLAAIAELKEHFGVKTNAEVIRKSISMIRTMLGGKNENSH